MPSKAQGLSLNTIVIAAIVLVVLLLLVGLTTGYFGKVWKPTFGRLTETSCAGQGGDVMPETQTCFGSKSTSFYEDVKEDQKCCLPLSCEERGGRCKSGCSNDEDKVSWPGCGSNSCCVVKSRGEFP